MCSQLRTRVLKNSKWPKRNKITNPKQAAAEPNDGLPHNPNNNLATILTQNLQNPILPLFKTFKKHQTLYDLKSGHTKNNQQFTILHLTPLFLTRVHPCLSVSQNHFGRQIITSLAINASPNSGFSINLPSNLTASPSLIIFPIMVSK